MKHYVKTDLIARKKKALEKWDEQLKAILSGYGEVSGQKLYAFTWVEILLDKQTVL